MSGLVLAGATAASEPDRAPLPSEPGAEAAEGTEREPASDSSAPDRAAEPDRTPRILPEHLAPRSVPELDGPIPPSAARRPAPVAAGEAARKPGAPVEIRTPDDDFAAQLGRQAARGGGVLGRYDGVMASKALADGARLNVVGGFPVAPANAALFDPSRSFYALSLDLAPFDDFGGRIFGVEQRSDVGPQRHAVGGELGIDHARGFGLLSVDYDVDFRDYGMLSLLASTKLDARTTLSAFLDASRYTNAPSAYSAIQDASVATVAELRDKLAQAELRTPSFDAGARTRTVTLGALRELSARLRLAADVTRKDLIPDALTPSLPARAAASELDYSLRAMWKDFLIAQSSTSVGLRIAELADSRRYTGSLGGQYPLWQNLRVGPDLAFELADAQGRWTYKPSMRFEYLESRLRLDLQLGLELSDLQTSGSGLERTGIFYRLGYRYDF